MSDREAIAYFTLSVKIRELQWKYLPGAKKAFDASIGNGVVTSLRSAFETLGNTSKKRFLIIQVSNLHKHRTFLQVPQVDISDILLTRCFNLTERRVQRTQTFHTAKHTRSTSSSHKPGLCSLKERVMLCLGKKRPGRKWLRRSYHSLLALQDDLASISNPVICNRVTPNAATAAVMV